MARYTGPKWKLSRRENYDLFGDNKWRKRPTLPGQHPVSRGRASNYAVQFREKQKVKRMYGILEKQFRNIYTQATKATGNTGLRLLQLLELRLDNVVYKMGLAKNIFQARQFVTHGHIKVNGEKASIPSMTLKPGDSVEYAQRFLKSPMVQLISTENKAAKRNTPKWLENGKVESLPTREMMDQGINEQLIIELYSRQ
ncbi:MAG TPA: 30S ribosomal protein S4 [Candidatus Dojkabacteria bacterium]|jgi:small subunit ribosomal protein S4|nr:30S ribosomal protein S4 [Candidatus Dojkabacteria bacterium]